MLPSSRDHRFTSENVRKDTMHTVSLVEEHLREHDAVIDIGCGEAFVLWQLTERHQLAKAAGVDIVDLRRIPIFEFILYDGLTIPVENDSFDMTMLNFVLHHVPNERKPILLEEARRVSRRCVFIVEDTPVNCIDRFLSNLHGEKFRRKIGSNASYGFYCKEEWEKLFREMGFLVLLSRRIGRFSRNWRHPFARSVFVLGV